MLIKLGSKQFRKVSKLAWVGLAKRISEALVGQSLLKIVSLFQINDFLSGQSLYLGFDFVGLRIGGSLPGALKGVVEFLIVVKGKENLVVVSGRLVFIVANDLVSVGVLEDKEVAGRSDGRYRHHNPHIGGTAVFFPEISHCPNDRCPAYFRVAAG